MIRTFDRRRDKPDHRDPIYKMEAPKRFEIPLIVDLRSQCPPVEDQGSLGSCTAHAYAGAMEFLELKNKVAFERVSRLFIYYNERVIEGDVDEDGGAELRDGALALARFGVPDETLWPYDTSQVFIKPSKADYMAAISRRITSYCRILNTYQMRNCLINGYPFVTGIYVYSSFMDAENGMIPMPDVENDTLEGGHAVLCVGYDMSKQLFIMRNSWSENWGDKGYFYLPEAYLENPNLADDFWVIKK